MYGLHMDASAAAYVCIIPFLLFFAEALFAVNLRKLIGWYTIVVIAVLSFITVVDLELYHAWGFRLDATPLQYVSNPSEMAASVSSSPILLLVAIFIVLALGFCLVYIRLVQKLPDTKPAQREIVSVGLSFFLLLFLMIPLRGGFQQIPLGQSDVYFSEKVFANHAAVNVPWNVLNSLVNKRYGNKNPYHYLDDIKANHIVDSLYHSEHETTHLLTTKRPNVIMIILESFTSKFIGCLGGEKGITPNLDKIASEGMLFTHIYASGDRSEKGLVALLSGYPAQTTTSVIYNPAKTERLPHFYNILKEQGYHTSYYYGGELSFANIKSYLLNSGVEKLVSKYDFDQNDYNSKWGVHDHILLNRFLQDLSLEKEPFFSTLFTLSSHEPYEIPVASHFPGNDEMSLFKNTFFYTDESVGRFIDSAKKTSWWNNTLVIMVADHGHRLPGNDEADQSAKFRIPLILTGGALNLHTVNNTLGSQTDVAFTILLQMGLPATGFKWSRNLMDSTAKQFAFYVFNDGFGFVTPTGTVTYDNVSRKIIHKDTSVTEQQLTTGKAYMQMSYGDFLKK
ncbi:MAG: LTA synthase family protein [Ginsengibacter sp.]